MGVDILGIDILGIDIEAPTPKKQVNEKSPSKCSICLHCNGQGSCSFIQTVAGVVAIHNCTIMA